MKSLTLITAMLLLALGCTGTEEVNCTENPSERACIEACSVDPTLSHCSPTADAGADADPADGSTDVPASNCTTECSGTTPICDETNSVCVQCLLPLDCDGVEGRPMCFEGSCVECSDSVQCDTAEASLCGGDGLCGACAVNIDCDGVMDENDNPLGVCDTSSGSGVCVGCTEATAADDCGLNSCNPATQLCTETERGDVLECASCVSDAECPSSDYACVGMQFRGTEREDAYCLKRLSTGCNGTTAYRVPTDMRTSVSGAPAAVYCGVNEALTTCEALSDLLADKNCVDDDDCGAISGENGDGMCAVVNGTPDKCTVPCGAGNQCPATFSCPGTMTYCGDAS